MRFRVFALVLVLSHAVTPVLRVACQIDCDRPPAVPACHGALTSPDGSHVAEAGHSCGHDHTSDPPALLGKSGARDTAGTFLPVAVGVIADLAFRQGRPAIDGMYGPPGWGARHLPARLTTLRI